MDVLALNNISKSFKSQKVLVDVNFSIENGLFGLLGPNGAGKSTLMKIIATLEIPDNGTAVLNGTDIVKQPELIREQLGYLPQEFGVYPHLSAVQLLDHFAIFKGVTDKKQRKQQIDYLLNHTNLWQHRHKAVQSYSGGMKQRFGVAQALLGDPKLLVVDEPTAGLDPLERNRFYDLLSQTAEDRIVILSTHIVEDVSVLCQNMAILMAGRIVSNGHPQTLLDEMNQQVWKKACSKEEMAEINEQWPIISYRRIGGQLIVHVKADQQPEGFEAVNVTLEDVYFSQLNQQAKV